VGLYAVRKAKGRHSVKPYLEKVEQKQ